MRDLIDRQAAIDEVLAWLKDSMSDKKNGKPLTERLKDLPSAQPEPEEFEWCHDCKEYDQEKHCCHRFTKVIRNTVEELKAYPITEDEAIKYLQETGWMDQHDKEMFDKGLNIQLADDSHSYDSLIPEQAERREE